MFENAETVAQVAGLKLLVSGEAAEPVTMCGFPTSGLDKYIGKLARAGYSVAVCSQVIDAPGVMRREITERIRVVR